MAWYDSSWVDHAVLGILLTVLFMTVGAALVFAVPAQYWEFRPTVAAIEETRQAVERTGCTDATEVLLAQARTDNATIRSKRIWNSRPVVGWLFPNGWDTVTVIPIPDCAAS